MKRQCALRLDLVSGETNLSWRMFDRLTGVNGAIERTISVSHPVDPDKIISCFNETVVKAINGSNQQLALATLRAWGSNSCKEIFPEEILRKLSLYDGGDILFMVPLQWADLPFELLYLVNCFIGERFQIGTILTTGVSQGPEKQYNNGGDLMIITDASQKLKSACHEGESLRGIAIKRKRQVRVVMKADSHKLVAEIPESSIVHFAGHSGPDQEYGTAGWRLGNGVYFSTDDIIKTADSPVLPWLVFSNSCDGGRVMMNSGLSGIAGAFLSAGVHQVVGPCCKLNDLQAMCCTMAFYTALFKGKSVAQALSSLRKNRPGGAGVTPLLYRLFGDPRYVEPKNKRVLRKIAPLLAALLFILFLSGAALHHLSEMVRMTHTTSVVDKGSKPAGFIIDFTFGNFIHFSVNTYAPAFIGEEQDVKQNKEPAAIDSSIIINKSVKKQEGF